MTGHGSHRPSDEERAFFEEVLVLRRRYAARGADDAIAIIGLRHAMARANAAITEVMQGRVDLPIVGN